MNNKISKQNNPNWRGGKNFKCIICFSNFWIKPSHFLIRKTCSKICSNKLKIGKNIGSSNPAYKEDKYTTLQCKRCNYYFLCLNRKLKNRQFCSRFCAISSINTCRDRTGINNPNYGNGNSIKGKKNPNWKNNKTEIVRGIRATNSYKKLRQKVLLRDRVCIFCGSENNLEMDHIKPVKHFPELILHEMNCRILCRGCHQKTPTYGGRII